MTSGLHEFLPRLFPGMAQGQPLYSDWAAQARTRVPPRDLVTWSTAQGLRFTPGTHFEYCTTNCLVLECSWNG